MTKMIADSVKEIPSGMEIQLNMVVIMMLNRKVMLLDFVRSFSSLCFFTVFYFGAATFSEIGDNKTFKE